MRNRFPFVFILLAFILTSQGCQQPSDLIFIAQYEADLKATEPAYEFVSFKFTNPYTREDSLRDELFKVEQMYDRYLEKFDYEMRRSRSLFIVNQNAEALRLAEEHLESMDRYNKMKQALLAKIENLSKEENQVLQRIGVHTYKANGTPKKIVVCFDQENQLLFRGTPEPIDTPY